ncbi:MAG: hypothetical protein FWF53_08235 [Candidatus Azobacteroides sp.]|nr:hypothetical protein [Candidatus Azobacteroides sp.]
MKKIFAITASVLLFISCGSDHHVDTQYQLTASVDLTTMVNGMRGGNNEDYYTKDSKDPVQLTFMVYDETGALAYETAKTLTNFFEKTSFTTGLTPGKYTVVAWACIATEGLKPDWESETKESLNTLKLDANYNSNWSPVLGVSKTSLTLDKSQTLNIEMPTVGCFYTIVFNYSYSTNAKDIVCYGNSDSRYYAVNDGTSNIFTSTQYAWAFDIDVNTQYTGTYICCFILPTNLTVTWGSFDANDAVLKSGQFSLKAEAGNHQIITVNIDTGNASVMPTRSAGDGLFESVGKQVFNVGQMKAEPAKVSSKRLDLLR